MVKSKKAKTKIYDTFNGKSKSKKAKANIPAGIEATNITVRAKERAGVKADIGSKDPPQTGSGGTKK
jgi:hypothetical protein